MTEVAAERDFTRLLRYGYTYFYRHKKVGDRFYSVEVKLGDDEAKVEVYFRHDFCRAIKASIDLAIIIRREAVGDGVTHYVQVWQFYPKYQLTHRDLTPDEYENALRNLSKLLEVVLG